jgi:hypothetical protein
VRDITLQGRGDNDDSLVSVKSNGNFIMESGSVITGNSNLETDTPYCNGGGIRNSGSFVMNGGEISGNSAINGDGGGVYGNFTMNSGEIKDNTAKNGGGVSGNVQITNGIIYGVDDPSDMNNATTSGKSLNGNATVGSDTITTTDDTIWIKNGKRVYGEIVNPPAYLLGEVWYTSQDNANKREGNTIEFKDDGRVFENDAYNGMTYSINGTTLTVKKATQQESRTLSFAGLKLTVNRSGTLLASGYFIPDPDYVPIFDITNAAQWAAALTYANGKKGKLNININIMNDIPNVAGITSANRIIAADGETLEITIKGIGGVRTMTLSSNGYLLYVGKDVTVTLEENLTLQGKTANTSSLVIAGIGGTLIMNTSVKITNNTNTGVSGGGGVTVVGIFIMNGGIISGNKLTASDYGLGGGVNLQSGAIFNMKGGTISGNSASHGGGVYIFAEPLAGGGPAAILNKTGGTISGNTGSQVHNEGTYTLNGVTQAKGAFNTEQ